MRLLGLDLDDVREAISAVSTQHSEYGTGLSEMSVLSARFAHAAWSIIAEPGDRDAGALVGLLGPATALAAVVEQWSTARIQDAASRSGAAAERSEGFTAISTAALDRWQPRLQSSSVLRAIRNAARIGARLITPVDDAWPHRLRNLGEYSPHALWMRGIPSACDAFESSVSLVGARASTGYGEHVTMEASAGLVGLGFSVVSGAAYGIDGVAHRAALAADGVTIAFLAGGVDRFYPAGHNELLSRIVAGGAVFSELPCGSAPTKWRFLQRNRLIAAVSCATVVLEAGFRSGSLNTAGHASALGQPLEAVPGPVTSPSSAGCHRLLREYDAVCVTNALEMSELAGRVSDTSATISTDRRSPDQVRVLDALSSRSPRDSTEVARRAGMSISAVRAALGVLELDREVQEAEGMWRRRRPG